MGVLGPDYRTLLLISFRFVSLFAIRTRTDHWNGWSGKCKKKRTENVNPVLFLIWVVS